MGISKRKRKGGCDTGTIKLKCVKATVCCINIKKKFLKIGKLRNSQEPNNTIECMKTRYAQIKKAYAG